MILWPAKSTPAKTEATQAITQRATGRHNDSSNLWDHTCFELFLGARGESRYFEVNVSPTGEWQCYCFDDERQGMRESNTLKLVGCEFSLSLEGAELEITLKHNFMALGYKQLNAGISAVIEMKPGSANKKSELRYYALGHSGPRPDFHCRENHSIQLTPEPI